MLLIILRLRPGKRCSINMEEMKQRTMSAEEKKRELFLRQKELLDTFLEHGAISREQYDKSLGDLTVKMGMEEGERNRRIGG